MKVKFGICVGLLRECRLQHKAMRGDIDASSLHSHIMLAECTFTVYHSARIEDQIGTFTVCRDGGDVEKTDLQWQDTGIRLADTEEESGESEAPDSSTKTKGKKQRIAERRAREKSELLFLQVHQSPQYMKQMLVGSK